MKIWAVIPAYNEGLSLEILLDKIKRHNLSILVVDDGSADNTYNIAKDKADLVIRNNKNLGKGMSLSRGITYLLGKHEFDYLLTMDADGQHSPSDIDNFIQEVDKGAKVLVGNRMDNHLGMPFVRVITNRFMSWLISTITHQHIPDTQCGFRLIGREVLDKIIIKTKKFEIESEIIIKAARLGYTIKSVPVKSIYSKNLRSKIQPFIDTIRFIKFLLRLNKDSL